MKHFLLPIITSLALTAQGQLVIDNATFFIGENAVVTVQGNLTTNVAIQAGGSGATRGKIQMKGASAQTITVNSASATIPRLEIDNTNHVQLAGTNDLRVDNQLDFTNGKLQLGARNILLPEAISITGAGVGKFIETNGAGEARQLMTANGSRVVPVGTGTHFNPTTVTTTGSTFGANAYIGVRSTGAAVTTPQRHPRTETFLNTAFAVTRSGVTGGTVNVAGTYTDGQIAGLGTPVEADLTGLFWDGAAWSLAGGTQNAGTNTIGANVGASGGVVYGMNKFVLANLTAVLQGAYNSGTGLMTDAYRANNLLPSTDPYRTFSGFTHVQNAVTEEISNASVFGVQGNANHNIVDWVFVQLRASNAPSTVLQTRAALVRANGEIIDIDNASPLYFKNVDAGNFIFTVRHRNHLGISNNPASPLALGLTPTAFNFSTSPASAVLGTAGTNYFVANSVRQLFAGDVTSNGTTNYIAIGTTDRSSMLTSLPSASPSATRPINSTTDYLNFSRGDLNFSRVVNYVAIGTTDRSYLLSTILGGSPTAVRTQINP